MVCRVNAKYGINCKGINLATVFPATWLNGTVAWLTAAPPARVCCARERAAAAEARLAATHSAAGRASAAAKRWAGRKLKRS